MSEEDKRSFLHQLRSRNKRTDTQNVRLFQILNTAAPVSQVDKKLYGKSSKNAYHALSKRLFDTLVQFVATRNFEGESSEEMNILKLLITSRILFEHKQYKTAIRLLNKAEQQAHQFELYALLNEIYQTQIQYAHLPNAKLLEECRRDYEINKNRVLREEQLNLIYADLKLNLFSIPWNQQQASLESYLIRLFEQHHITFDEGLTFRSLYQVLSIATNMANARRDYYAIVDYMPIAYRYVEDKKELHHKHLYYHIHILRLISYTFFRTRDFAHSMMYADRMEMQLKKDNQRYYKQYQGDLLLIQSLNLHFTQSGSTVIGDIEAFKKESSYLSSSDLTRLQLDLCLCIAYFHHQEYQKAHKILGQLPHTDTWYSQNLGMDWMVKKNLIAILLAIELGYDDLVHSRVRQFKKLYADYDKQNNEPRILIYVQLVYTYYTKPERVRTPKFHSQLKSLFTVTYTKEEDIYTLCFYAWLRCKIERRPLYETTLSMLSKPQA